MSIPSASNSNTSDFQVSLQKARTTLANASEKTNEAAETQTTWSNDRSMMAQVRAGLVRLNARYNDRLAQFKTEVQVSRLTRERTSLRQYQLPMWRHPLVIRFRIGNWRYRILGWLLLVWIDIKRIVRAIKRWARAIWKNRYKLLFGGLVAIGILVVLSILYLFLHLLSENWEQIQQTISDLVQQTGRGATP